ncbi:MAG: DNA polymerase III subunit delta [Lachnospiraceae bacterium]
MKSLNEDLKTLDFKHIYLLYGEENYLKKQYKEKLTKGILGKDDTMNYAYYEGKGVSVNEVIDLAETLPFFSERRLIVMENTGFFKNATPELAEYMKQLPNTTYFLCLEQEIDKRGKLFKAVKDKGRVVELERQDEQMLIKWIFQRAHLEKKQIVESTIRYLIEKVGINMETLQSELEKLCCYTLERESITKEDIDAVCTTQVINRIFDMVNAVADKKQKKALTYYYDLLALKEPPMRILYLMSRQFRLLLEVKELDKKGYAKKEIGEKAGLNPFVVGKYQQQAKVFRTEELREILEAGVETETSVKTGKLGDVLGVELFIVTYSMPRNQSIK